MELRERKVDVNALTPEQVDALAPQIGSKMTEICEEAAVKANRILSIYGMSCKIAIAFDQLPDSMQQLAPQKKKRTRKPKTNNLKV